MRFYLAVAAAAAAAVVALPLASSVPIGRFAGTEAEMEHHVDGMRTAATTTTASTTDDDALVVGSAAWLEVMAFEDAGDFGSGGDDGPGGGYGDGAGGGYGGGDDDSGGGYGGGDDGPSGGGYGGDGGRRDDPSADSDQFTDGLPEGKELEDLGDIEGQHDINTDNHNSDPDAASIHDPEQERWSGQEGYNDEDYGGADDSADAIDEVKSAPRAVKGILLPQVSLRGGSAPFNSGPGGKPGGPKRNSHAKFMGGGPDRTGDHKDHAKCKKNGCSRYDKYPGINPGESPPRASTSEQLDDDLYGTAMRWQPNQLWARNNYTGKYEGWKRRYLPQEGPDYSPDWPWTGGMEAEGYDLYNKFAIREPALDRPEGSKYLEDIARINEAPGGLSPHCDAEPIQYTASASSEHEGTSASNLAMEGSADYGKDHTGWLTASFKKKDAYVTLTLEFPVKLGQFRVWNLGQKEGDTCLQRDVRAIEISYSLDGENFQAAQSDELPNSSCKRPNPMTKIRLSDTVPPAAAWRLTLKSFYSEDEGFAGLMAIRIDQCAPSDPPMRATMEEPIPEDNKGEAVFVPEEEKALAAPHQPITEPSVPVFTNMPSDLVDPDLLARYPGVLEEATSKRGQIVTAGLEDAGGFPLCHYAAFAASNYDYTRSKTTCDGDATTNAVRCCSETFAPGWSKYDQETGGRNTNAGATGTCPWTTAIEGSCKNKTIYPAAKALCAIAGGRLCTKEEIEADCTRAMGCGGDGLKVWSSTYNVSDPYPENLLQTAAKAAQHSTSGCNGDGGEAEGLDCAFKDLLIGKIQGYGDGWLLGAKQLMAVYRLSYKEGYTVGYDSGFPEGQQKYLLDVQSGSVAGPEGGEEPFAGRTARSMEATKSAGGGGGGGKKRKPEDEDPEGDTVRDKDKKDKQDEEEEEEEKEKLLGGDYAKEDDARKKEQCQTKMKEWEDERKSYQVRGVAHTRPKPQCILGEGSSIDPN